jgi:hypothetical protein
LLYLARDIDAIAADIHDICAGKLHDDFVGEWSNGCHNFSLLVFVFEHPLHALLFGCEQAVVSITLFARPTHCHIVQSPAAITAIRFHDNRVVPVKIIFNAAAR